MCRSSGLWSDIVAEVGGGQGATVIGGGHDLSISSGTKESDDVAAVSGLEQLVSTEHVAAFADGAHDVGLPGGGVCVMGALVRFGSEVKGKVVGTIHGWTNEFGKAGIDNDKPLGKPFFDIEGGGKKAATLTHHTTAELEMHEL